MTKRYDITSPRSYKDRDGNDRTSWVRLGTAFEKEGKITLLFDALPIAGPDGVCKAILMEPKDKGGGDDYRGNHGAGQSQDASYRQTAAERREFAGARQSLSDRDLDDAVPF